MDKRYVIFAPHVDDEVIGCFRLLNSGEVDRVVYFYDLDDTRKAEAISCGRFFNFTPIFAGNPDGPPVEIPTDLTILAPNINDVHPHHKKINRLAKSYPHRKQFYSIDMNCKFDVLSTIEQAKKKIVLNNLFPSQRQLLTDEKYHLFESLVDSDTTKMIWVTFQRVGFHRYKQAEFDNALSDVSYLANTHRHLFKFKVSIEVNHSDRDIEFHQFLNWLESRYIDGRLVLDHKSCEMVADELADEIMSHYSGRKLIIDVSEDGECGCTCEYQI